MALTGRGNWLEIEFSEDLLRKELCSVGICLHDPVSEDKVSSIDARFIGRFLHFLSILFHLLLGELFKFEWIAVGLEDCVFARLY